MKKVIFNDFERLLASDFTNISTQIYADLYDGILARFFKNKSGFFGDSFAVTRVTSSSVSIAPGRGFIYNSAQVAGIPSYVSLELAAAQTLNIAGNGNSFNRIDLITAKQNYATLTSETRQTKTAIGAPVANSVVDKVKGYGVTFTIYQGTPAASPVIPTTPAGEVAVCIITVSGSSTNILNQASITDKRVFLGTDLVSDLAPLLGGNLDLNGYKIVTTSGNRNIVLSPHGTGSIVPETSGAALGTALLRFLGTFSTVNATNLVTTGAATLGDATSPLHTLQGTTAADYQVKITNNSSNTASGGLYVNTVNTNANSDIQGWYSNGTRVGFVNCAGKFTLGVLNGGQIHLIRGVATNLIRPNDAVNNSCYFGFANAAGTEQALVGLGANTGAAFVTGEYNNGLVFRSIPGMVWSGVNNRVDGYMSPLGVFGLGNVATVGKHWIQGNTPGDYQLEIKNNSSTQGSGGLRTSIMNSNVLSVVQDWTVNGVIVGAIYGTGKFMMGAAGSTVMSQVNGGLEFAHMASPANPPSGFVSVFVKSDNKIYTRDSSGLERAAGTGGSSGINYIPNPDFETGLTTGWTVTGGAVFQVMDIGNAGIYALRGLYTGRLADIGSGGAKTAEIAFYNPTAFSTSIDARDKSSQLRLSFDFNNLDAAGARQVVIWDGTNEIIPNITNIPTGKGRFEAVFSTSTASTYTLRFKQAGALAGGCYIDNLFVGPQEVIIGPAITDWVTYSPTVTGLGTGAYATTAANLFQWRREGDTIIIRVRFLMSTAGSGAVDVSIPLPTGLSIDTTKISSTGNSDFGRATVLFGPGSSQSYHVIDNGLSAVRFYDQEGTWGGLVGSALVGSSVLWARIEVPIAGWTSNLQIANNNVEYLYNTSTTTTDDLVSFGYGAQGSPIYAFAPANNVSVVKRVRASRPLQASDVIKLDIFLPSRGWMPVADSSAAFQENDAGTIAYGMRWFRTVGSSTDIDVMFQSKIDKAGTAWTSFSSGFWRITVSTGVNANVVVGDKLGVLDSTAAAASYVGELLEARQPTQTNFPASNTYGDARSVTLGQGWWRLSATLVANLNGSTTSVIGFGISSTLGNFNTGLVMGDTYLEYPAPASSGTNAGNSISDVYVYVASGSVIYYLKVVAIFSAGTPQYRCRLSAQRYR